MKKRLAKTIKLTSSPLKLHCFSFSKTIAETDNPKPSVYGTSQYIEVFSNCLVFINA